MSENEVLRRILGPRRQAGSSTMMEKIAQCADENCAGRKFIMHSAHAYLPDSVIRMLI